MEYKKLIIKKEEDPTTITVTNNQLTIVSPGNCCIRSAGELTGKAFYLSKDIAGKAVDWIIARDSYDDLCVIPLSKEDQDG